MQKTSSEGKNSSGGVLTFWGYSKCPRCDTLFDKNIPGKNPLREGCGHVWCGACFKENLRINPDGCLQCDNVGASKTSSQFPNSKDNEDRDATNKNVKLPGKKRWMLCFDERAAVAEETSQDGSGSGAGEQLSDATSSEDIGRPGSTDSQAASPESSTASSQENQTPSSKDNRALMGDKNPASSQGANQNLTIDHSGEIAGADSGHRMSPLRSKNLGTEDEVEHIDGPKPKRLKKGELPEHITVLSNEGGLETYKCGVCSKQFKTRANIKYHSFCGQNIEKPYKCETCGKGFVTKSHFEYHVRFHTGERPFKCNICGKAFSQSSKLNRHKTCHNSDRKLKFKCRQCNKSYSQLDGLKAHCAMVHNAGPNLRRYACTSCPKRFRYKITLEQHVSSVHDSHAKFMCATCDKGFDNQFDLFLHVRKHDDAVRRYKCETCGKTFVAAKDLARHELVHSPDKPWKCAHCDMAFKRKDHLDRHERQSHKDQNKASPTEANDTSLANTSSSEDARDEGALVETNTPAVHEFCPPAVPLKGSNVVSKNMCFGRTPTCTEVVLQSPPLIPQTSSNNPDNNLREESVLEVSHVSMDSVSSTSIMSHKRIRTFILGS